MGECLAGRERIPSARDFVRPVCGSSFHDGGEGPFSAAIFALLPRGLLTSYEAGMIYFGILSASLAGGVFFVLRLASGGGAGEGDIFLSAAIASWLSPVGTLGFLWAASASCALFSLPLLISGRRSLDDGIRFAPFLAAGGIAAFFFEETGLTLLAASWLCSR